MKNQKGVITPMVMIAVFVFSLIIAGCAGGPGKLDVASGWTDDKGEPVMEETTESVLIAEKFADAIKEVKEPVNPCSGGYTPDQVAALKEGGQQMYMMDRIICNVAMGMSNAVKSARDLPTTAAGEVAHAGQKAIATTEKTDAAETAANTTMTSRIMTGGFIAYGFGKAMGNGGSETTYGDIEVNASNSGTSTGGGGGGGQLGDRNIAVNIGGGTTNFQPGDSNTQATAEKATSVDNPIVSGGPNNSIVNDADANGNDGSLF